MYSWCGYLAVSGHTRRTYNLFKDISVEYVDSMGSDLFVANVARVSFAKWKEKFDGNDEKLIAYLAKHKHTTPFRHPHLAVRCQAPIFLARQLGKHQVGLDWNEVSRRYVKEDFTYFKPEMWRKAPEGSIKQGSKDEAVTELKDASGTPQEAWEAYIEAGTFVYDAFIESGVAPELARMVLPQGMNTSWIWTGSLLAFSHIYNLRADFEHAQKDLKPFVEQLDAICMERFPVAWKQLTYRK